MRRPFPQIITEEELEKQSHISDDTINADINETLREIKTLKPKIALLNSEIDDREKFVEYLQRLLSARHYVRDKQK